MTENGAPFISGKDDKQTLGFLRSFDVVEPGKLYVEEIAVKKDECSRGLLLSRGGDIAVSSEVG